MELKDILMIMLKLVEIMELENWHMDNLIKV